MSPLILLFGSLGAGAAQVVFNICLYDVMLSCMLFAGGSLCNRTVWFDRDRFSSNNNTQCSIESAHGQRVDAPCLYHDQHSAFVGYMCRVSAQPDFNEEQTWFPLPRVRSRSCHDCASGFFAPEFQQDCRQWQVFFFVCFFAYSPPLPNSDVYLFAKLIVSQCSWPFPGAYNRPKKILL